MSLIRCNELCVKVDSITGIGCRFGAQGHGELRNLYPKRLKLIALQLWA